MKKGNIKNWANTDSCINLLFFSQLVNELLIEYSIPSNRVSTLNSHFLCVDALSAINTIQNNGVPEGSLKPIVEELHMELSKDIVFSKNEKKPTDYFLKLQNEKYILCKNPSEMNFDECRLAVNSVYDLYFSDGKYYGLLKNQIIDIIISNDKHEQPRLFRLVKSLITELMNEGYNQRYISDIMRELFWNSKVKIREPKLIYEFFERFDFKERTYDVVFAIKNNRVMELCNYLPDIEVYNEWATRFKNNSKEKIFIDKNKGKAFVSFRANGLDPISAALKIKNTIEIYASAYRLGKHIYGYDINTASCGVYTDNNVYMLNKGTELIRNIKPYDQSKIDSINQHVLKAFERMPENVDGDTYGIIGAVRYHSHALTSSVEENQLLDFWCIFEALLDISNKHTTDRINQVCMYLIPILKRKYMYSLFLQLSNDIKAYSPNWYEKITRGCEKEEDVVKAVIKFTILPLMEEDRNLFIKECDKDFPLLRERIEYYNEMLDTPQKIYVFVEKHAKRVKWQIMRIYRNRNLIIHNANPMPYLTL